MKLFSLSALAITLMLSACSPSVPKCSDTETINLVKEIAGREMRKQVGEEAAKAFSYAVEAIRTTNTHEQTGAHECAAEIEINGNGRSVSGSITYTVEMTDDGEQFYVKVFGL